MNGTVTIELNDFKKLEQSSIEGKKAIELVEELDTEMFEFLQYLSRTNDMNLIAEKYNLQGRPRTLKIARGGWRLARKD